MGFGPFSSSSKTSTATTNSQVGSSDQAVAQFASGRSAVGSGNIVSSNINAARSFSASGGGVIRIEDSTKAFDAATEILKDLLDSQANLTLAGQGVLKDVLGNQSRLVETKVSDGGNITAATLRTGLIAAAVIAVAYFFFRR